MAMLQPPQYFDGGVFGPLTQGVLIYLIPFDTTTMLSPHFGLQYYAPPEVVTVTYGSAS